jgi:hypothetical protein
MEGIVTSVAAEHNFQRQLRELVVLAIKFDLQGVSAHPKFNDV